MGTKAIKAHKKAVADPLHNDPVLTSLRPDLYFGCLSERYLAKLDSYTASFSSPVLANTGATICVCGIVCLCLANSRDRRVRGDEEEVY